MEDVEGGSQQGDIPCYVVETSGGRTFETMSWDSISDLLNGVVWELELVAVSVDQLGFGFDELLIGSHGRQRSGRSRMTGCAKGAVGRSSCGRGRSGRVGGRPADCTVLFNGCRHGECVRCV